MSMLQEKAMKFLQKTENYEIKRHPQSDRLYHIEFAPGVVQQFFSKLEDVSPQRLEYVPYMRLIVAAQLEEILGSSFKEVLRNILQDRQTGGFTVGVQGETTSHEDYVIFATAITHLVGVPNHDSMSGKYYARFTVQDTDTSDSYLRQAYRLFTLHTDGTFVDEATDWLLMMKMQEENAVGGESRLLHLDDWEELDTFYQHPLASYEFTYKAPASKNVAQEVKRAPFFLVNNKPCMCFIDQFVYPETTDQAKYLKDLSDSMENDKNLLELVLPTGDLVMLNNLFWLHGRAAFEKNANLYRELMRQRGRFAQYN